MPAGSGPRIRLSWAIAPSVLARSMAAAPVIDQPNVTAGTTTDGLNTANADATRSPGACPSRDPRLQKYAEPSGRATPLRSAGLGGKPSCAYSAWHSGEKYTCPAKGSIAAASFLAFALSSSSSIMGLSVVQVPDGAAQVAAGHADAAEAPPESPERLEFQHRTGFAEL